MSSPLRATGARLLHERDRLRVRASALLDRLDVEGGGLTALAEALALSQLLDELGAASPFVRPPTPAGNPYPRDGATFAGSPQAIAWDEGWAAAKAEPVSDEQVEAAAPTAPARVEAVARKLYGYGWELMDDLSREAYLQKVREALADPEYDEFVRMAEQELTVRDERIAELEAALGAASATQGPSVVADSSWADTLPPCHLCGEDVPWADALLMPCGSEDEVTTAAVIHRDGCPGAAQGNTEGEGE